MCDGYGSHIPCSAYLEAFSQLKVRFMAPGGAPNLEPRDGGQGGRSSECRANGGASRFDFRFDFRPKPFDLPRNGGAFRVL